MTAGELKAMLATVSDDVEVSVVVSKWSEQSDEPLLRAWVCKLQAASLEVEEEGTWVQLDAWEDDD